MSIATLVLAAGLAMYVMRASFVVVLGRLPLPEWLRETARLVPTAVLTALAFPELVYRSGVPVVSVENYRLVTGIVCIVIAWRTRSTILTITAGLGMLWLMEGLFG